jgi:hypothetical protein
LAVRKRIAAPGAHSKDPDMVTRMLSQIVTFRRPFLLDGFDQIEPAGAYTVDTEEESLDEVSFPVWKRNATVMHILHGNETAYVKIDPDDLRKALERDAGQTDQASADLARLEVNRGRNNARMARRKKF